MTYILVMDYRKSKIRINAKTIIFSDSLELHLICYVLSLESFLSEQRNLVLYERKGNQMD